MTRSIVVNVLPQAEGLPLPAYQSAGAAGMDLLAALPPHSSLVLEPGARERIPTGLAFALPDGIEGQVRPRSGLALRTGVTVLNAPGTIDSDFRGEVEVLLVNHGREAFEIVRGARIAQIVFARVERVRLVAGDIDATARGAGGFGSTGLGEPVAATEPPGPAAALPDRVPSAGTP